MISKDFGTRGFFLMLGFFISGASVHAQELTQVAKTPEPQGQVLGFYTDGHLHRATSLSAEGKGFANRSFKDSESWGSQRLIEIIEEMASQLHDSFPAGDPILVGDLSREEGGPIEGHASHQNGLDADVMFLRSDHVKSDESLIENGHVKNQFDLERNWTLIKFLGATGRIGRIFMDRVIKKAFCELAKARGEVAAQEQTLRRLRHFPQHEAHFHIRLNCPSTSPKCQTQADPPTGSGCDEGINPLDLLLDIPQFEQVGDEDGDV